MSSKPPPRPNRPNAAPGVEAPTRLPVGVLNPATTDTGVATPGGPALDVLTRDESLGGDGTPTVAAFTPETFALKLGISPAAGPS